MKVLPWREEITHLALFRLHTSLDESVFALQKPQLECFVILVVVNYSVSFFGVACYEAILVVRIRTNE